MGRTFRLRRGRSPLHAVEETIAALYEELEFTTNFAHAMVREENYIAAAEVIDEQRRSLVRASNRIERVLRAPEIERSKMRTRAALVGLAAALALGTGAFAAFGPGSNVPTKVQAIQDVGDALEAAVEMSDPVALRNIVVPAQGQILEAAKTAASDPQVKAALLDTVEQLQKVIGNRKLPAQVREQAKEVVETVQQIVGETPTLVETEEVDTSEEQVPEEQVPEEAAGGAPAAPTAP